jgi:hypothetical protein
LSKPNSSLLAYPQFPDPLTESMTNCHLGFSKVMIFIALQPCTRVGQQRAKDSAAPKS